MAGQSGYGGFGKIPAAGDFFRFDLPGGFVSAWDDWLQKGIPAARAHLGEAWQEGYFSAPIWRFTLTSGLAGPFAVQGVLMASVDRVGRQFPLTLARVLAPGADALACHLATDFAPVEALALLMLEDGEDLAQLRAGLAGLSPPEDPPPAPPAHEGPGWTELCAPGPGISPGFALAARLAAGRCARPALFTALTPRGERLILSDGLPAAGGFHRLFAPESCAETPR